MFLIRSALVALAFLLPLTWLAAAVLAQNKIALVIGNAAYKEAPLQNPVNDARAMAAKLRQLGFKVIAQENATKAQMEKAVLDFGESLSAGAVGMFYYAGHGLQVNGRNFLVPVDATMRSEQRVRLETLDVDILLDQMDVAKSSVNLVILDACRNNPFERRLRSTGSGLAQINAPQGTLIAYATAPGKVAADGDGANGVYTARLLQHMSAPGLAIEEVFKRVRAGVARDTNGAQTPWESSSLTGGFFFVEPQPIASPPAAAAPAPPPSAPAIDREALFWQSIGDSNDPAVLQAYLSQYPSGAFAPLARAKIASLERRQKEEQDQRARAQQLAAAPTPPPTQPVASITPEQALWDAIKDANNPAMFQGYLDRYPNGLYAQAAAVKVAALRPPPAPTTAPAPAPSPPPVPQAAAPVPPASSGSTDERWRGRGSVWSFDVRLVGDQLSGTARNLNYSGEQSVSGRVDANTKEVSGVLNHPRLPFPARIAGRFPTINVITNGPASDTVVLEPVAGSAPRPAAPLAASAPAATSRDGKWTGTDGDWTVHVEVSGDRLTGIARTTQVGAWTLNATIATDGTLTGTAMAQRSGFSKILGRFPAMEITGSIGMGARITLQPAP